MIIVMIMILIINWMRLVNVHHNDPHDDHRLQSRQSVTIMNSDNDEATATSVVDMVILSSTGVSAAAESLSGSLTASDIYDELVTFLSTSHSNNNFTSFI